MRIVLLGEGVCNPSGFGQQMRDLAVGLIGKGHEVVVLAATDFGDIKDIPAGVVQWPIRFDDFNSVDKAIERAQPDAVITFWTAFHVVAYAQLRSVCNVPLFFWLPWEASTLKEEIADVFRGVPDDHVVSLTKFGQDLWSPFVKTGTIIPHGIDLDAFKYEPEKLTPEYKKELRKKWGQRLRYPLVEDAIVVLNLDRNIWHKRWDATYDTIRRVIELAGEDQSVQLIAHTKIKQPDEQGFAAGYDLFQLERLYDIEGHVAYTGFDWDRGFSREEIVELYQLCDVRISTSGGEGFGIPTVEAQAVGCLQVVNDTTTMPELLGEKHLSLVLPATVITDPRETQTVLWEAPDATAMATRILEVVNLPEDQKKSMREDGVHRIKTKYTKEIMVEGWDEFLNRMVDPEKQEDLWYKHRWGYTRTTLEQNSWTALANTISQTSDCIKRGGRVLVLGAFDGQQVDLFLRYGFDAIGIEPDERAFELMSEQARLCVTHAKFSSEWPSASIAVLTDCVDLIMQEGSLDRVVSRLAKFEWVFLRPRSSGRWGTPALDSVQIENLLESKGLTRRADLEDMAKTLDGGDFLSHQIYQRGSDTSVMPSGLVKLVDKDSDNADTMRTNRIHEIITQ